MPNGLLPCVIDSNILIDLEHGHIPRILFQLPLYLFTTRLVISELYVPDGELVQSYGVTVRRLAPDDYLHRTLEESASPPVRARCLHADPGGKVERHAAHR